MYVFFLSFIVEVNTTTNCHLSFKPIGQSPTMSTLDYVQPIQTSNSASNTAATPSLPAVIKDYDANNTINTTNNCLPRYAPHWPKKPPILPLPVYDMSLIPPPVYSVQLKDLDRDALIQRLYSAELAAPPTPPPPASEVPEKGSPPTKLECMSTVDIVAHLHHPESCLLPIRSCDTPNSSDTKITYTPEELNCLTGCHHFCNYQHIILTTKDGTLINTGDFSLSLGTYATIQKAPLGKAINRLPAKYLGIVHINIAFGDCVSVRGLKFTLIFVDPATCYNWTFGLKSLQHKDIQSAFLAFCNETGSLACQFQCNCNDKLFGGAVHSFLHLNRSSIAASPAGRQSSNGLVESHWKIMVHMLRAYLIEKQMPRTFWYYAIKHSARMMNMIPGKYCCKLASPFMLVHGVRPNPRTWLPLFLVCYFHHKKDSNASRFKSHACTMDRIVLG
jgi:hypothetical protein